MKRAILFGDYSARYHPVGGVHKQLQRILEDSMEIFCTDDKSGISLEELKKYDLCISYCEFGADVITKEQTNALISYVSGGGGLLVLHNGISLQSRPEIRLMLGAKFTGHPDYTELPVLPYRILAPGHPVMEQVEEFTMCDEPYQFVFDSFADKTILMEYAYNDVFWPAAWALDFGMGRVVYLAPGHNEEGFRNLMYGKIIHNSAGWCAGNT